MLRGTHEKLVILAVWSYQPRNCNKPVPTGAEQLVYYLVPRLGKNFLGSNPIPGVAYGLMTRLPKKPKKIDFKNKI